MKALHSFETSGTYYPVTLRHTLKGRSSPVLHHFFHSSVITSRLSRGRQHSHKFKLCFPPCRMQTES